MSFSRDTALPYSDGVRVHPRNTEGVLKSPLFKDAAVSREVSPCPFFFGYVKMLQEMRTVAIGR